MNIKQCFVALVIIATTWKIYQQRDQVRLGDGVYAPDEPVQENLSPRPQQTLNGYQLTGLAKFTITAKVLAKKSYHFDRESDLSPVDLALGWGNMSDEQILDSITISQSGRFYYWRADVLPLPHSEITTHSANMHLIPANKFVARAIKKSRHGDIISMSGQLVNVQSLSDSWQWRSSLTRSDSGAGACELILVEHFSVVEF